MSAEKLLPEHLDRDTLKFISTRLVAVTNTWSEFMMEVDPMGLPPRWLENFTAVMENLSDMIDLLVEEARQYGFELPGDPKKDEDG